MTKVPVNFRIDSELLEQAKAQSVQQGISLIALLERSLRKELGVSASVDSGEQLNVEAIVDTVVKTVKTDIDRVKVNITDVEAFVKTIKAEVVGLAQQLNIVSTTVDTILNTNTVNTNVESAVNTNTVDTIVDTIVNTDEWVSLPMIADELGVLSRSITNAAKRGRDIGNGTIEIVISGQMIRKRGKGIKALYQIIPHRAES